MNAPIHTCAMFVSPVVISALEYFWSASYEVWAYAEGSKSGFRYMFAEKRHSYENRYLHAAAALVMIVEREIEWSHAVAPRVMESYIEAKEGLARWGRTEWENVPLPFGNA